MFPVIASMRVMKRHLKIEDEYHLQTPSPFMNYILGNLFASERHLLPLFPLPYGVSFLAVAQKEP
jgi:hypothetical protein